MPHIYNQLATHYGLATISLIEDCQRRTSKQLDLLFRDDCHHTEFGAAAAALGILDGIKQLLKQSGSSSSLKEATSLSPVPAALDPRHWSGGKAYEILAEQIKIQRPAAMADVQQIDRDPITGKPAMYGSGSRYSGFFFFLFFGGGREREV